MLRVSSDDRIRRTLDYRGSLYSRASAAPKRIPWEPIDPYPSDVRSCIVCCFESLDEQDAAAARLS
jgi:hypothetical protein